VNRADPSNPFPGLRPFREDEETLFFGREARVDAIVDQLASTRFLAVVGTSGSGKSSLVNCGLVPALHRGLMSAAGSAWRVAMLRPGNSPLRALGESLARPEVLAPRADETSGFTAAEMTEATLRLSKLGLVDAYEQAHLGARQNLLVVVDQFEELFRYQDLATAASSPADDAPQRSLEDATVFVNLLLEVLEHPGVPIFVVLTMRSDFLGECARFFGLPEAVSRGQYLVPRMTRDERRAAIAEPLRISGAAIDPVLLTRLVNDVGDNPDQLSILQHALNRTWTCWRQAGGQGPLTLANYERAGTMADALNQHAEEAFGSLAGGRPQVLAVALFKAITDKVTDARGTRRPTRLDVLCAITEAGVDELRAIIEVFRDPARSFLMPPTGAELRGETPIDISHETLMRIWTRLRDWAEDESKSAATYRGLAETAQRHAVGKASLLSHTDLQFALDWEQHQRPNAAWAARYGTGFDTLLAFLRASQEADVQKQRAKKARARRNRLLSTAVVVASVIVAVAMVLLNQRMENQRSAAHEAQRRAEQSRADAERLVGFLIGEKFLEKLRPVGSNALLAAVQSEVRSYLQAASAGGAGLTSLTERNRALAVRNEGDMLVSQGKSVQAIARFADAAAAFEKLAASADANAEDVLEQARAMERMGTALLETGRITQAFERQRGALALRQAAHDRGVVDEDHELELSLSHTAVARVLNRLGRPREALVQHLEPAKNVINAAAQAAQAPANRFKALVEAEDNLAESRSLMADDAGSSAAYRRSLDAAKRWVLARPLATDAQESYVTALSRTYRELGQRARKTEVEQRKPRSAAATSRGAPSDQAKSGEADITQERREARDDEPVGGDPVLRGVVRDSNELLKNIAEAMRQLVAWDPSNATWKRNVPAIQLLRAEELMGRGRLDEAEHEIDVAQRLFEELSQLGMNDALGTTDLGWLYQLRGRLAAERKRWPQALEEYRKSEQFYASAMTVDAADVTRQREWCWAALLVADVATKSGQADEAIVQSRRVRAKLTGLMALAPESAALEADLMNAYDLEVRAFDKKPDTARADVVASEWRQYLTQLIGRLPNNPNQWAYLQRLQHREGNAHSDVKRWTAAEKSFRDALESAQRAFAIDSSAVRANQIYLERYALSETLRQSGNLTAAIAELERALEANEKSVSLDPSVVVYWSNRALAWSRIAELRAANKDRPGALADYGRAVGPGSQAVGLTSTPEERAERSNSVYLVEVAAGDLSNTPPKDAAQALRHFRLARPWIERAIAAAPTKSLYFQNLSVLQRRIGTVLQGLNDVEGEETAWRSGFQEAERGVRVASVHEDVAGRVARLDALRLAGLDLGEFYVRRKETGPALGAFQSALRASQQAVELEPAQATCFAGLRLTHKRMAEFLIDPVAQGEHRRRSAEAAIRAADISKTAKSYNEATHALVELGEHNAEVLAWDDALVAYGKAARQAGLAIRSEPRNEQHHVGRSVSERGIAEILEKHDRVAAAVHYETAIVAGQRAVELQPSKDVTLWALYIAQWKAGGNLMSVGQKAQGSLLRQAALDNARRALAAAPTSELYKSDVAELQNQIDAPQP